MADTAVAGTGQGTGASQPTAAPRSDAPPGGQRPGTGPKAGSGLGTPPATPRPLLRGIGVALLLLGILVLGFAGYLYGLSGVQEARSQTILYTQLSAELSGQVQQTAPLGPTTPGSPVAVLTIPSIGVHSMVVVEGTSPENLTLGPGHLRSTPLPGQAGVCTIYGRVATFGAPFGRIAQLRQGDTISVITGQGQSAYKVAAVADSRQVIQDPAPNRLLLLTASSAVVPSYYLEVDARLISTARPGLPPARVINAQELPLAGDSSALTSTVLWALALAMVSAAGTLAVLRWSPWAAYLATAPLALAVLWNLYQSLAMLLPNLY